MPKARELINLNGHKGPTEKILSGGVAIRILPFPPRLWEEIQQKSLEIFPDPDPPRKTVNVLGGTEEVDDLENSDYKAGVEEAKNQRGNFLWEAISDFSVELDLEPWEPTIKRLEKYTTPFPVDPTERKIEFLNRYACRTKGDFELIMVTAATEMLVSDPEVLKKLESFRDQVA